MSGSRKSLRRHCGPLLLQSKPVPRVRSFEQLRPPSVEPLPVSARVVRFGPFEVNFDRRELRKHGMRMRLEDKPFEILEAFLRAPSKLITRAELRARLWPDTFVSFEHCLNTAVNKLRFVLGDSSRSFRFIETVRRRGYRFVGALENSQFAGSLPGRLALLVLPFRTQPAPQANDSFAAGLTEELSAQFGRLDPPRLGTIAVSTAMLYKSTELSIAEIARGLAADLVLEGSVRCSAGQVRITVQLVRAADQLCLWSELYDGTLADPLACQSQVAQLVTSAVASELNLRAPGPQPQKFARPIPLAAAGIRKISS